MTVRTPRLIAGLLLATALAGCGRRKDHTDTDTATISFAGLDNSADGNAAGDAQTVSVSVPGFSAKLNMPGLNLGAKDMNIDGIALHPGASVSGMQVMGAAGDGSGGEGHGTVELRFADPAPPAQVLAYYRQAAAAAGWTETPPAAGQQFAATKPKESGTQALALQIGAAGPGGSTGRFLVTGS